MRKHHAKADRKKKPWERCTCSPVVPRSIHPLGQVVAALEGGSDLVGCHGRILLEVLRVLPLEELDSLLSDGLAAEVAVGRRLLVLRLAKRQGNGDGAPM